MNPAQPDAGAAHDAVPYESRRSRSATPTGSATLARLYWPAGTAHRQLRVGAGLRAAATSSPWSWRCRRRASSAGPRPQVVGGRTAHHRRAGPVQHRAVRAQHPKPDTAGPFLITSPRMAALGCRMRCRRRSALVSVFTPEGAAYVSYNTLPGCWRMRGMVRPDALPRRWFTGSGAARGPGGPSGFPVGQRAGPGAVLYGMLLQTELDNLRRSPITTSRTST